MPKQIFVSYNPNLLNVVKGLHAQYPDAVFIVAQQEFQRQLYDLDLPVKMLGEGVTVDVRGQAFDLATQMIAYLSGVEVEDERLDQRVKEWFSNGLAAYLYPQLPELLSYILSLNAMRPDLCIIHNDVEPMLRATAQWAKYNGVPCLHVPHAVYVDDFDRGPIGSDIHDIVTASHIVVAGSYQDTWYRLRGGATRVTGLPQFDKWATMQSNQSKARQMLGLDPNKPVVVFASSWRQDTNLLGCHDGLEEAYTAILNAARALQNINFVIKLHPRTQGATGLDWHVNEAKKANVNVLITPLYLEQVLQAADMLVAYGPSNIVIEAAHLPNLRLVSIGGFGNDNEVLTVDSEHITDAIALGMSVAPVSSQQFVYKYAGVPDGLASQRIVQCAGELLA
jgi:hypothetical protein